MNKVVLRTSGTKQRRVVVRTTVSDESEQEDQRQGNIDTTGGTKIRWVAKQDENVSLFTVRFFNLSDNSATWPFVENADGTGTAPIGYVGPLTLTPGSKVRLTTKIGDPATVKYEVDATPIGGVTIDNCDPMIIIRPGHAYRSNVLFGVTCAVLGAVAGALLVALWT